MSRVTRWWWIRHAPVAAPAGRLYGRSDVAADFSDTDSLAALAAALPDRAIWLASPLQRATKTAEALLAAAIGLNSRYKNGTFSQPVKKIPNKMRRMPLALIRVV